MLTDAHCHPFDLSRFFTDYEYERKKSGVMAAASACDIQGFSHNELLAHNAVSEKTQTIFPCFGIHPQLPKILNEIRENPDCENLTPINEEYDYEKMLENLHETAFAGRITAVGEFGFDLFNDAFRQTEAVQDKIFDAQLETALYFDLPVVLHVRRAMHKIFNHIKNLSKCKSVIFHSWSGTCEEALSLLRRGVNAYFSFGNIIMLNHKQAVKTCALLPAERLLTETDAPYQPRRGFQFSNWSDLPLILEAAAAIRSEAGEKINAKDLETQIEKNFCKAFFITHQQDLQGRIL